jgi:sugar phosphate isomerase/epimerase
MLRLAVPTTVFQQPLRRAIESAARTRAAGVQFDLRSEVRPAEFGDTALRQLLHYLDELDLKVASATLPTQGSLADPDRLDARVAAIKQGLEFARKLGAGVLTVRLGTIPADPESRDSHRLLDVLSDLARHGNRVGATAAVSTFGNTPAALQSLLAAARDEGPLGLDFDPAGFVFAGLSPAKAFRDLHALSSHVQVRDGLRSAEGTGVETAIGAGLVEWDEFLATIAEADYSGWLTIRRTGGEDLPGDVTRGVQYVGNVMSGR